MKLAWTRKPVKNSFDWDLRTYKDNQLVDFSIFPKPNYLHIFDEKYHRIDTETSEYPEQCLAYNYIDKDACVLELGARYGSVSCIINLNLNDRTKQVSVEPDSTVWKALEDNIERNGCNINLFKGFVSKKKRDLLPFGYAATSVLSETTTIPSASVEDIEQQYNLQFNTLVADCEGFLEEFFDEHPHLYDQLNTVIFEADYPSKCNYQKIRTNLKNHGFREIINGFQNVYKK